MAQLVVDRLFAWAEARGRVSALAEIGESRLLTFGTDALRPGADPDAIDTWEQSHGYALPEGLRVWLGLSNGFYRGGPLIHPLPAIGPMIAFARFPDLIIQPESWFELGNPRTEPVCLDLAYRWPGGDYPIFTSGDDDRESPPRLISRGFDDWFMNVLRHEGKEHWFEPGFVGLGDPWTEHRRRASVPPLPDRLQEAAARISPLLFSGIDERGVAAKLGLVHGDVETIFRHLQHVAPVPNGSKSEK